MLKSRILQPEQINLDGNNIIDIQCGKTFSSFISVKNEVLVCGVNDLNQLGIYQPRTTVHIYNYEDIYNNKCSDVVVPTPLECFTNMKVRKIACGESHCLAVII
jgi:alpha-tubulin suppressor-like RCC1 family protein